MRQSILYFLQDWFKICIINILFFFKMLIICFSPQPFNCSTLIQCTVKFYINNATAPLRLSINPTERSLISDTSKTCLMQSYSTSRCINKPRKVIPRAQTWVKIKSAFNIISTFCGDCEWRGILTHFMNSTAMKYSPSFDDFSELTPLTTNKSSSSPAL